MGIQLAQRDVRITSVVYIVQSVCYETIKPIDTT